MKMRSVLRVVSLAMALCLLCCATACSKSTETASEVTTATATTQSTTVVTTTTTTTTTTAATTTTTKPTATTKKTIPSTTSTTPTTEDPYERMQRDFEEEYQEMIDTYYDFMDQNKEEIVAYIHYIWEEYKSGRKGYYDSRGFYLEQDKAVEDSSDPVSQSFFKKYGKWIYSVRIDHYADDPEGDVVYLRLARYDEETNICEGTGYSIRYFCDPQRRAYDMQDRDEESSTDNGLSLWTFFCGTSY